MIANVGLRETNRRPTTPGPRDLSQCARTFCSEGQFVSVRKYGFAGNATDQVCVHDENANDADPNPTNNCATVTIAVP